MPDKPIIDGPSERAAVVKQADYSLIFAVDEMRRRLGLTQSTSEIVSTIKETMNVNVPPHGYAVVQALCERERQKVFNRQGAAGFPEVHQEFGNAIRHFLSTGPEAIFGRKLRNAIDNAWKQDPAADRRIRKMEDWPPDQFRSPYRGQPERYDPEVILAFEKTVVDAIGRSRFSWTRRPDEDHNKSSGVILDVLVAAVQWAICIAWQCSAPPGTEPMRVKAEGLLGIIKRHRMAD